MQSDPSDHNGGSVNKVVMESVLRIVMRRRHVQGEVGKSSRALARALLKAMRTRRSTSTVPFDPDSVVIDTSAFKLRSG